MNRLILHTFFAILLSIPALAQHEASFNTKVITNYDVKSIENLNTSFSEFSPVLIGNRIVFTSDRDFDYLNWGENRWKKRKFLNVFGAEFFISEKDSAIVKDIQTYHSLLIGNNHTGPLAISPDGNTIVFTQVGRKKHSVNRPQLYIVIKSEGKWSSPQLLPFCENEHSYGHPAFSDDGTTLFFSSDREGGFGGKDIYKTTGNGKEWSNPVNCGELVNSKSDEVFPYVNGNVIYFSSNRSGGSGGLDLYKSYFRDKLYSPAENLGTSINSTEDDFGIFITKNGKHGFFSSSRANGKGADDIYFVKITETALVESKDLMGRFSFRNLNTGASDLDVLLVDDSGRVVLRVKTDEKGEFAFRNLPVADNYTIRLLQPDPDLKLEIIDKNGESVAVLRSDQNGRFLYKKLDPSLTGTLSMMETEETELGKTGRLNGQFIFEKLPNSYPGGLNVYLVDEEGIIHHRSKTDDRGNFSFRQLDPEKNYLIRTDSTSDDVLLLVYNKQENIIAEFRRDANGNFIFRKLSERSTDLALMENGKESEMLATVSVSLAGQFKYRTLDGSPANMSFFILDDNGKVLHKGRTDENGFFRARNLLLMEQYIFQIDPNDPNIDKKLILDLIARNGRSLIVLENDKTGRFVYKRLKQEFSYIKEISTEETRLELPEKIPFVYFEKNSARLDEISRKNLDKVALLARKIPGMEVHLSAHTDSRADESFNNQLSEQRLLSVKNYLIAKGVSAARIKGNYYGEGMLLNHCGNDVECDETLHRQNRRCEIRLVPGQ